MEMIHHERIKVLNSHDTRNGDFILYWMQSSQRILHNHALEFSIDKANELHKPLIVFFGIAENYPEANERHFKFMLEGLKEVYYRLHELNIRFVVRRCDPVDGVLKLSEESSMVVCDRGYLKHQVDWRQRLVSQAQCPVAQVESDVVIPVVAAADKEMYSAATLRPRIHRRMDDFLFPPSEGKPCSSSMDLDMVGIDISDPYRILEDLDIDRSVKGTDLFFGGTSIALDRFHSFLANSIDRYHLHRNDPALGIQSNMGPYLHFGQISPLTLALGANEAGSQGTESFLEELIVRRELAYNFVHYNHEYDSFHCLPNWARRTLEEHSTDLREYVYSREELEKGRTHDTFWNAAQKEMVLTGKMHNYMRMYWGKKILEWTQSPSEAFATALYLNNRYSLDGRDPNSYAGVAWCFGKHDRPWTERPIFGKVRYMNDKGLKRKFKIDDYVNKVDRMEE